MFAGLVAAASGGRVPVDLPTLTHVAGTGFTITNYDAQVVYSLSAGSRTGDAITLAFSTPATLTASSPKGTPTSAPVALERRAITYTSPVFVQTGVNEIFSADCSLGGVYYADGPRGAGCYRWEPVGYYRNDGEDSPPEGFVKLNGEWVKIA